MTTKTEPYEILVRFEGGKVRGAHYIEKQIVLDDSGKQVGATLLPARAVSDAGAQLTDVFGANADALSQITDLQSQLADLQAQLAAAKRPSTSAA